MNYIVEYPGSAVLYFAVFLLSIVCATAASTKQKSRGLYNPWLIFLILLLSIFAGMRSDHVGVDVAHYIVRYIEPIQAGRFFEIHDMSVGFKALVWLFYLITDNAHIVLLMIALLTNALIVLRLWDFRKKSSFSLMIAWYYCVYYLVTFNIFRQFIAVAIVFYSTRFLEEKRYRSFIVGVIVATTIHNVSILGFIYLTVYILLSSETHKERKLRRYLMISSPILILIVAVLLYRFYDFDHYLNLLNRATNRGTDGISFPVKIILGIILYRTVKKNMHKTNINEIQLREFGAIYSIGLLIGLLSYISFEAERFTFYFMMYEMPYVSFRYRRSGKLQLIRYIYIAFMIYTMYSKLSGGGSQIMPYTFYWQ